MMSRLKNRLSPTVQSGTVSKLKDRLESGTSKTSDITRARQRKKSYEQYREAKDTERRQSADYSKKYDNYIDTFETYKTERDEYVDTLSNWENEETRTKERSDYLSNYDELISKVSQLQASAQRISGTTDTKLSEFKDNIVAERNELIQSENTVKDDIKEQNQKVVSDIYSQYNIKRNKDDLLNSDKYVQHRDSSGVLFKITEKPRTYQQSWSQGGGSNSTFIPYTALVNSEGEITQETVRSTGTIASNYSRGSGSNFNYGVFDKVIANYQNESPTTVTTKGRYKTNYYTNRTGSSQSSNYGDYVSGVYNFDNSGLTLKKEYQPYQSSFQATSTSSGTLKRGIYLGKTTDYKNNLITDYNRPMSRESSMKPFIGRAVQPKTPPKVSTTSTSTKKKTVNKVVTTPFSNYSKKMSTVNPQLFSPYYKRQSTSSNRKVNKPFWSY